MVKLALDTGVVEARHGVDQGVGVQAEFFSQLGQAVGDDGRKHRWHEAAHRFGIDDGVANLALLASDQAAPNGVALGPKILALVVKTLAMLVDHDAQGHAVQAGGDAPVKQRRAGINGHAMRLGRVANRISPAVEHVLEKHAHVEARAPDQKVVGGPFAPLVLAPGLALPGNVGFIATASHHTGAGGKTPLAGPGRDKSWAVPFQSVHLGVVDDVHAQLFGTAEIGVDQGLAPAHEKRIGARQVQSA